MIYAIRDACSPDRQFAFQSTYKRIRRWNLSNNIPEHTNKASRVNADNCDPYARYTIIGTCLIYAISVRIGQLLGGHVINIGSLLEPCQPDTDKFMTSLCFGDRKSMFSRCGWTMVSPFIWYELIFASYRALVYSLYKFKETQMRHAVMQREMCAHGDRRQ